MTGRSLPNNGSFAVADPRQELYSAGYGVNAWGDTSGAVAGESLPSNGRFAVADPRAAAGAAEYQQYGVLDWRESSGAVIGVKSPGQGTFSVADPRAGAIETTHKNVYRVVEWDRAAGTVTWGPWSPPMQSTARVTCVPSETYSSWARTTFLPR